MCLERARSSACLLRKFSEHLNLLLDAFRSEVIFRIVRRSQPPRDAVQNSRRGRVGTHLIKRDQGKIKLFGAVPGSNATALLKQSFPNRAPSPRIVAATRSLKPRLQ